MRAKISCPARHGQTSSEAWTCVDARSCDGNEVATADDAADTNDATSEQTTFMRPTAAAIALMPDVLTITTSESKAATSNHDRCDNTRGTLALLYCESALEGRLLPVVWAATAGALCLVCAAASLPLSG